MADYRRIMMLLIQQRSYRQIEVMASCSHRAIARARRVLDEHRLSTVADVEGLSAEDLDRLFSDGRKSSAGEFAPIDFDSIVQARVGRKKPPLKVLWAKYVNTDAPAGVRHYGYDRFCELVAEHVRVHDLTAPIRHVPGHTMQVDWAGSPMQLLDPITRESTRVSVFVATLPYSGFVYARGHLDEKLSAWCDGHQRAFEFIGGVPLMVVPDNASTASNQISKTERTRDVNAAYAQFLEHHRSAAVPTRSAAPRDKGNVEAGVKVVTNWAIHYLADQIFASLDDLNEALAERVEWINHRTPFRGEERSRHAWFTEAEKPELLELPEHRWEPVVWRKAKVHRDWHIQIDTIKYSVPYEFAGVSVDVRIVGSQVEVLAGGDVVARHRRGRHRNGYVTDPDHAPAYLAETAGLWTRAYFLRQAAKVGPATVAALERLLDRKKIEAQGFRSCMNILDLGKRRGRVLLEQACQHLIDSDEHRQITYTAVKNTTSALQAQQDERPRTLPAAPPGTAAARASSAGRDTSGAHLAGISAFSLEALTAQNTREADDA